MGYQVTLNVISEFSSPLQMNNNVVPELKTKEEVEKMIREKEVKEAELRKKAIKLRPILLRREKIARELLETEHSYVDNLIAAVRVYLEPLASAVLKNQPIISSEEIKTLFSIMEPISKINGEFLVQLRVIVDNWSEKSEELATLLTSFVTIFILFLKLKQLTFQINEKRVKN